MTPRYRAASTTDAGIAVSNLNSEIAQLESALVGDRGLSAGRLAELGERLTLRGQFLGRVADYERASEFAEQGVRREPKSGVAWMARAKARATFHEFEAALADLDQAASRGVSSETDSVRASIFQATGRYDEALLIRRPLSEAYPTIASVGAVASILAERGDWDAAETEFGEALALYRDVSPFPVAFLLHQQGMMWMRAGDFERARDLLGQALAVLPVYAQASGHLAWIEAALGHSEEARARLEAVAEKADDPEAAGFLAHVLQLAGRTAEAKVWRDAAATQYEHLLARHPSAFLDHAATFWLSALGDPKRALRLAKDNVELRQTPMSWTLLMQAAQANGETAIACRAARKALGWGQPTSPRRALADRAAAERVARGCDALALKGQ